MSPNITSVDGQFPIETETYSSLVLYFFSLIYSVSSFLFRSDAEVRSEVKDFFEMDEVFTMKLLQDKWYHLDTCFLPLG